MFVVPPSRGSKFVVPPSGGRQLPAARLIICLIAFLCLLSQSAHAQAPVKGEIVSVGIGGNAGANGIYRIGNWVPVQVRLHNVSTSPVVAHLGVQSTALNDLDGDRTISHGPAFTLNTQPEPRTFWTYYWPGPDDKTETGSRGINSVLVLEGEKGERVLAEITTPNRMHGATGLGRSDEMKSGGTNRSSRFVVILGKGLAGWSTFLRSWGGTENIALAQVTQPTNLPDDVKGFDAVDVIVWEADSIKVSDMPAEFQLKAMLQWVRSGGHLIISTGSQWQEFQRADTAELQAALPMTLKGSRQVKWEEVRVGADWSNLVGQEPTGTKTFEQVTGDLKGAARGVLWPRTPAFANAPLVVTGLYGQGAVTLITFDVTNADFANALKNNEKAWANFWTQAAGWMSPTDFMTATVFDKDQTKVVQSPAIHRLGESIPADVDVSEQTAQRLIVAILFLAIYWLLAGPIGHLILRVYRVVHWSWWVFGGTVLIATLVASGVVTMLHISTSEVRHRTFVLGRVNSRDVSVASYYGIYAPSSGAVELKQPDGPGMSYLVPMCFPISGDIKSYADPQSYHIWADQASTIAPIFRNTLKKMQGRWTGQLPGITGDATYSGDPLHALAGTLVNESDYDLYDVKIVVYRPLMQYRDAFQLRGDQHATRPGDSYLYKVGTWKKGEALNLATGPVLELGGFVRRPPGTPGNDEDEWGARFGQMLQAYVHTKANKAPYITGGAGWSDPEKALFENTLEPLVKKSPEIFNDDLLAVLLDARGLDPLIRSGRAEVIRGSARLIDSTKQLHAAGALIIARSDRDVKAAVPLTANGSPLPSKGYATFVWALSVAGEPPASFLPPLPPASGPAEGAAGGRGGAGGAGGVILPEN
jgi:hypothetical protein